MALKFAEGFGQFQGQTGATLHSSLANAGYTMTQPIGLVEGRHEDSYAIELGVASGPSGTTWSGRVNGSQADLMAVAYAAGRWVAVNAAGSVYTSTDTITWTLCAKLTTAVLRDVAYGNGKWVAVGNDTILTSSDGTNWTLITPPESAQLNAVAYGDDVWVAVGQNSTGNRRIFYSLDDGDTWDVASLSEAGQLTAVIYTEGLGWFAGGNTGAIHRSADGITWTSSTFTGAYTIVGFAFDGTQLAVAAGPAVYTTTDGTTWGSAYNVAASMAIQDIAYANGLWIVVGGIINTQAIYTSTAPVGVAYTRRNTDFGGTFTAVAAKPGVDRAEWVAVGTAVGDMPNTMAGIYVSSAPPTTISRTFTSSANKVVLGFAHTATTRGRICSIADVCNIDWPAGIEILGQRGNAVPIRNAWYYYELTIDKTAGKIRLNINDTLDLEVNMPTGVSSKTSYTVTWQSENGSVAKISDIYWLDSSNANGEELVDRIGPIRIPVRFPTADELAEWGSTEAGDHWSVVGNPPPNMQKYLYSAVSGAQELFTSDDELPEGAGGEDMPIIAVGLVILANKSDFDGRQIGMVVGEGGSQLEVVETQMTMDPKYSYAFFEKAPGGDAWDDTNVIETPFGVVVRP